LRLPRLKSGVDPRLAFAGTFHVNESFSQLEAACAETDDPHIYLAGAGSRRGGGVSGIAGHNAAMALLGKSWRVWYSVVASVRQRTPPAECPRTVRSRRSAC